jgi:hypothetical protein
MRRTDEIYRIGNGGPRYGLVGWASPLSAAMSGTRTVHPRI